MNTQIRDAALPVIIASLLIGAGPLAAQATPPSPPRVVAPRPPRPPRAPRVWFNGSDSGVAKIDTVVSFSANGTVELSLVAGAIKLSTWDRNQVRVVASTEGEASLHFDANSSHVSLEESRSSWRSDRHDDWRNGNGDRERATYDVTVPTGSRATLSAVSGTIDASGIHGSLEVNNVSGSVDVRDVGSSVSVEGVSGRITVANIGNDARVQNVSGRISVTGVGGTVSAETVSGSIVLAGLRGDRVHATSVSGSIDFTGTVGPSARYEFETHSGRTELRLASNANAAISVETFSGGVSNDYPGAVRRRNGDSGDDQTNFDYVIGRGEGRVRAETFSGTVHISRGNP